MTGYELSRNWFDWCFENPEKIKPNHTALYFFIIEHCNRMGWKSKFGIPTEMTKEAIGIKSYNTYSNTLNDLVDWGFINMIEKSKNQYSANIIALSNFDKALDKALDKATIKHVIKQSESTSESTSESIDSIDKPLTKNKRTKNKDIPVFSEFLAHAKDKKNNVLEESVRAKYDSWIENDWKNGNDKPIKNWKSTLTNTVQYLKVDSLVKVKAKVDESMVRYQWRHDQTIRTTPKKGSKEFFEANAKGGYIAIILDK